MPEFSFGSMATIPPFINHQLFLHILDLHQFRVMSLPGTATVDDLLCREPISRLYFVFCM